MMALASALLMCGRAGDGVERQLERTQPRDTAPADPTALDGGSSSTSTTTAPTAPPTPAPAPASPDGPVVGDAGPVAGGDPGGPFGRLPGRGAVAPAPPSGPLVDGRSGPTRAAVVAKIDNAPEAWPQVGLNHADVTFELLVEGISRIAAVFHSEDAAPLGPVRSARTSDANLLSMLNRPCFGYSGGNSGVVQAIGRAALVDVGAEVAGDAYYRAGDREIPHNLMTSTDALRSVCVDSGQPTPLFGYGEGATGTDVGAVAIEIGASRSMFVWDGKSARWLRFVGEYAHVDSSGVQVSPTNVVVLETTYLPSPADARSPEAQTTGSGTAWVLLDGRVIAGSWERASPLEPYRLLAADGNPIVLRPGRTWVALPPPGDTVQFFDRASVDLVVGRP